MTGRYKIRTISELCGFSPTLLRAWESRHRLLEPVRQPSGHRLYTDDDLAVLRRVGQLLAQGQSIGEIAAFGRKALLAGDKEGRHQNSLAAGTGSLPVEVLKNEILRAAVALDESGIRRALDRLEILLTTREIVHTVVTVLSKEIGSMWVTGKATVASEHLLSSLLHERVRRWTVQDPGPGHQSRGKVLCAGFPDEQHELGLLIVAYELRGSGREVLFLGAGMPFIDLELAIATAQPQMVCLSVTRQVVFEVHRSRFAELVQRHPNVRFLVGGAGAAHLEAELEALGATAWPAHRSLGELGALVS